MKNRYAIWVITRTDDGQFLVEQRSNNGEILNTAGLFKSKKAAYVNIYASAVLPYKLMLKHKLGLLGVWLADITIKAVIKPYILDATGDLRKKKVSTPYTSTK